MACIKEGNLFSVFSVPEVKILTLLIRIGRGDSYIWSTLKKLHWLAIASYINIASYVGS